jgi:hypothetical protein
MITAVSNFPINIPINMLTVNFRNNEGHPADAQCLIDNNDNKTPVDNTKYAIQIVRFLSRGKCCITFCMAAKV